MGFLSSDCLSKKKTKSLPQDPYAFFSETFSKTARDCSWRVIIDNQKFEISKINIQLLRQSVLIAQTFPVSLRPNTEISLDIQARRGRDSFVSVVVGKVRCVSRGFNFEDSKLRLSVLDDCSVFLQAYIHGVQLLQKTAAGVYQGPCMTASSFHVEFRRPNGTEPGYFWTLSHDKIAPIKFNASLAEQVEDNDVYDWLGPAGVDGTEGEQHESFDSELSSLQPMMDFTNAIAEVLVFDFRSQPLYYDIVQCQSARRFNIRSSCGRIQLQISPHSQLRIIRISTPANATPQNLTHIHTQPHTAHTTSSNAILSPRTDTPQLIHVPRPEESDMNILRPDFLQAHEDSEPFHSPSPANATDGLATQQPRSSPSTPAPTSSTANTTSRNSRSSIARFIAVQRANSSSSQGAIPIPVSVIRSDQEINHVMMHTSVTSPSATPSPAPLSQLLENILLDDTRPEKVQVSFRMTHSLIDPVTRLTQ